MLEATNPATGKRVTADDLSVIDWNDEGTAMLQDALWADGARLGNADYADITTRFVAASLEGWMHCRDNSADCVEIVLNNGSSLGASHQAWQMNEINGLIWPSPGGAGVMDEGLWAQTVNVATSQGILASAPDSGSYTTEYAEAAVEMLKNRGVDTTGKNWRRVDVTLNPGGE